MTETVRLFYELALRYEACTKLQQCKLLGHLHTRTMQSTSKEIYLYNKEKLLVGALLEQEV